MKTLLPFIVLAAFGLMAFSCEGKAPVVHLCKAYADEASCVADTACKWQQGDEESDAKCKAR